jgi:hypothetical protein
MLIILFLLVDCLGASVNKMSEDFSREEKLTDEIKELSKQKNLNELTSYAKDNKIDLVTFSMPSSIAPASFATTSCATSSAIMPSTSLATPSITIGMKGPRIAKK